MNHILEENMVSAADNESEEKEQNEKIDDIDDIDQ